MVKSTKGSRKREIKKIENEAKLHVTFSKRKAGLFKKASELCTLCDAEILMIVFSPGGKPFCFSHPNPNHLLNRFFNLPGDSFNLSQQNNNVQLDGTNEDMKVQHLRQKLNEELANLKKVEHNGMMLEKLMELRKQRGNWYDKDVGELNLNETNQMLYAIQGMKNKLVSNILQHSEVPVSHNYPGENSGLDRNVDVGIDYPNMNLPNQTSDFGYNNDGAMAVINLD